MKKLKVILFIALSIITVVSCVDDDVVEDFSGGSRVVGFKNTVPSYIYTETDTDPVQIFEPIDLIGGANGTYSDTDITVTYAVDPSSTAIAGTHYVINNTGNTLTIPAGGSFVKLPITVYPTALPANLPQTIKVNLTEVSSQNGVISSRRNTVTITIARCQSALAGNYNLAVTRVDNNVTTNYPNQVITQLGIGQYLTETTGNYPAGYFQAQGSSRDGFVFNDVCQEIVVPEQNLADFFANLVYGYEDPTTGSQGFVTLDEAGEVVSITIFHTIEFSSGTVIRQYKAVYTKI